MITSYSNYGDKNFLEYGRLVAENEDNPYVFRIIVCNPYPERNENDEQEYQFGICHVDLSDSWIDAVSVAEFAGLDLNSTLGVNVALACIDYYGMEEFVTESPFDWTRMTYENIIDAFSEIIVSDDTRKTLNFNDIPYDLKNLRGTEYIVQLPSKVRNVLTNALKKYIDFLEKNGAVRAQDKEIILKNALDGRLFDLEDGVFSWRAYTQNLCITGQRFLNEDRDGSLPEHSDR